MEHNESCLEILGGSMDRTEKSITVIIPTLNAKNEIEKLVNKLLKQSYPINEIIVIDSSSEDGTVKICNSLPVKLINIARKDFDHGKTRDIALRESKGDIVIFMTQDAVPTNNELISELVAPFSDPEVAIVTGRQLPKSDASAMEKAIRKFNYPSTSQIRTRIDIPQYGIKTFFSSDVCAAYNRLIYEKIGGFEYPLKTNEDMFFAAKAINAGYKVIYNAEAKVFHSHNLSLREQYRRNYIQGYEIEKHQDLLNGVSQNSEGIMLVKFVSKKLLAQGRLFSFIHFGMDCIARYMGSKNGKKAYLRERN